MSKHPPVLSPVDYDAWSRGYMPPSEHILIDELSFRGARVVAASTGPGLSYWLVIKGKPTRATLKAAQLALLHMEEDLEPAAEAAASTKAPNPEEMEAEGDSGAALAAGGK